MSKEKIRRKTYGDWQTPESLAKDVCQLLSDLGFKPNMVIEPNCGTGTFLAASDDTWADVDLIGFDINSTILEDARLRLNGNATLETADFFKVEWNEVDHIMSSDSLLLGNPPWVTASELSSLEGSNLPKKENFQSLPGLSALTGKSNFDISEWMMIRLLEACKDGTTNMAFLLKSSVARRLIQYTNEQQLKIFGSMYGIDTKFHFGASVDAVLLIMTSNPHRLGMESSPNSWPSYPTISSSTKHNYILGYRNGVLCNNLVEYESTLWMEGESQLKWRSGLKHDAAKIMELNLDDGIVTNQSGDTIEIEDEYLFPLLKGSDIGNGRTTPRKAVIVPQRKPGANTSELQQKAPLLWAYLSKHKERMRKRKSKVYKDKPDYSIFGIGEYSFAEWKIGICGMYKTLQFTLIGPHHGKPVMLDDTCNFLSFDTEEEAKQVFEIMNSDQVEVFLRSRMFVDSKRPFTIQLLKLLNIDAVLEQW